MEQEKVKIKEKLEVNERENNEFKVTNWVIEIIIETERNLFVEEFQHSRKMLIENIITYWSE